MRNFFLSVGAGAGAIAIWMLLWILGLRVFGIVKFPRTPEAKAGFRDRIKQLGKKRYILLFGICGWGVGTAVAITAADTVEKGHIEWTLAAMRILFLTILGGWGWGRIMWEHSFRESFPFGPYYPPKK